MTVRVSTNFKERILGTESFASIFNGGRILIYSGTQPSSADSAATGTLLATVTNQGIAWLPNGAAGGLNFTQDGPWMANDPTQSWTLVASAAGDAGWFRLMGKSQDNSGASLSAPRIDGSIGESGTADMKLEEVSLTVGYTIAIQQFLFSFPTVY